MHLHTLRLSCEEVVKCQLVPAGYIAGYLGTFVRTLSHQDSREGLRGDR